MAHFSQIFVIISTSAGEAAIVIYVNKDAGQKPILPDSIEGIPVTVVLTDEFIAR